MAAILVGAILNLLSQMKCLKLKKTEIIIEMQQEDIGEATKLNNNPDEELEF